MTSASYVVAGVDFRGQDLSALQTHGVTDVSQVTTFLPLSHRVLRAFANLISCTYVLWEI